MKKSLVILGLMMVLSGCTFYQQKDEAIVGDREAKPEKKIGVVTTPADQNVINPLSPFMFITDTSEKFFVDSTIVNLRRYNKRRVEITGNFNDQETIFSVQDVTSLGQETQVKQAYENAAMGIKFQYPSIWMLKEDTSWQSKVVITPYEVDPGDEGKVDTITIERSENNRKQTAQQWLNLDDTFAPKTTTASNTVASAQVTPAIVYQPSFIGVGQMSAVKATTGTGESVEFFVPRDTSMYHLKHVTMNDADKDLYRNAFFDIVSSLEYIPFGKTAGTTKAIPAQSSFQTTLPAIPEPKTATSAPKEAITVAPTATPLTVSKPSITAPAVNVIVKSITQTVTAKAFAITFLIPSNWYWGYANNGYDFATKPIDEISPSDIVGHMFKYSKSAVSYSLESAGQLNGKALTDGSAGTIYTVCIASGSTYCISGSAALKETFKNILASIK